MKSSVISVIYGFAEKALKDAFGAEAVIFADLIPNDGEGVCMRHDPAPAAARNFSDGSRTLQWNLTFYARRRKSEEARDWAKAITDFLNGAELAAENGTVVNCEAATLPQFVGVDEKGLTTYAAAITASYLEEGEGDGFPFE